MTAKIEQEIDEMLKSDEWSLKPQVTDGSAAPPPKTQEQIEQEKFDAVVDGPFTLEALRDAAIESFKYRLPKFVESSEAQIRHGQDVGNLVAVLESYGLSNFQLGVARELKAKGMEPEIDGTKLIVPLPDAKDMAKKQIKSAIARGAFVAILETHGAKKFQETVVGELHANGFPAEVDGTKILVPVVVGFERMIEAGEI